MRRIHPAFLLLAVLITVAFVGEAFAQDLTIGNYQLISSKRITRTVYEYVYKASVTNPGPDAKNVKALAKSNGAATTIVDGVLDFGNVASGASVASIDTFTIRQDRTYAFSWANVVWEVGQGEAVQVIQPEENGILTAEDGTQLILPAGALSQQAIVGISPLPLDSANIAEGISAGIEVLKIFRFYCTADVLNDNAEISIQKPSNVGEQDRIFVGKVLRLDNEDYLMMVDMAFVNNDRIVSSDPATPGLISAGTFAIYVERYQCGVPDYANLMSTAVAQTCLNKLKMHIYLHFGYPALADAINNSYDEINGLLTLEKFSTNMASTINRLGILNGIGGKSIYEIWGIAGQQTVAFATLLYGNEYASIWYNLLTCAVANALNPYYCLPSLGLEAFNAFMKYATALNVQALTRRMNEALISDDYLRRYYAFGGELSRIALSYGLDPNSSQNEVIRHVAASYKDGLFSFDDYDLDRCYATVTAFQAVVDYLTAAVDPDFDGLHNFMDNDNCPTTYNPDQADSDGDRIGDACEEQQDFPVNFPDPNLEAAIREDIGKPTGDIMYSDLQSLSEFGRETRGITNIEGLQHCSNLRFLTLGANPISDISPLAGLTQLTMLELDWCRISDIHPLAGLTQLTHLNLFDNPISDISPLAGLTQLTFLVLGGNQFSDISPLAGLTQLTMLDLTWNQISDIHPLVENMGIDRFDYVYLLGNPLSLYSCHVLIPILLEREVFVYADPCDPFDIPTVLVSPAQGPRGTVFSEPGYGFTPYSYVTLHFLGPDGSHYSDVVKYTDGNGNYTHTYQSWSGTAVGQWEYYAVDNTTGAQSESVYYTIY